MLVKLLGLADLAAVLVILAAPILPMNIIIYSAGYLIFKGGLFAINGNIISILDVVCGILTLLMAFDISSPFITLFMLVFLVQKVFFSFV
ncbi:hypothetical protein HYU19_01165 [Candidatus Woesearchaeota archaeon]|nr:hypothetical protein [Candidatus Woesearchaeota archaeon]